MEGFKFEISTYPLYGKISNKIIDVHDFDSTIENISLRNEYFSTRFGIEIGKNVFKEYDYGTMEINLKAIFGKHYICYDSVQVIEKDIPGMYLDYSLSFKYFNEIGKINFNEIIAEKLSLVYDNIENETLPIKILFIQFLIDDINKEFGKGTINTLKLYSYVKYSDKKSKIQQLYKNHIKLIKKIIISDLKQYLFETLTIKKVIIQPKTFIALLFELNILDRTGNDYKEMDFKVDNLINDHNHKLFNFIEIKSFHGKNTLYDYIKSYKSNPDLFNTAKEKAETLILEYELNSD